MSNSRRASRPMTKKKNVISPSFTQWRRSSVTPAPPTRIERTVRQTRSYEPASMLTQTSAATVAASRNAALPVSVLRKSLSGVSRLRAQAVRPENARPAARGSAIGVKYAVGRRDARPWTRRRARRLGPVQHRDRAPGDRGEERSEGARAPGFAPHEALSAQALGARLGARRRRHRAAARRPRLRAVRGRAARTRVGPPDPPLHRLAPLRRARDLAGDCGRLRDHRRVGARRLGGAGAH